MRVLYKIWKHLFFKISFFLSWIVSYLKFKLNGVVISKSFQAKGIPIINVNLKGKCVIGENFSFHSGKYFNMIGRQQPCFIIVSKNAELIIGDNVGISCTAIVCNVKITIGNNVRIGGGVVLYDSDFHSLDVEERISVPENLSNIKKLPIEVKDGAFIGAHSIILKGVTIGENSIIGAGSVVSTSVPDNQIWGGNPARFIKNIA